MIHPILKDRLKELNESLMEQILKNVQDELILIQFSSLVNMAHTGNETEFEYAGKKIVLTAKFKNDQ